MTTEQPNFNEANIEDIRRAWAEEMANDPEGKLLRKQYTMLHRNSPCDLDITDESMKCLAKALVR